MHIGLVCPELSGHLNPMTTLGRELAGRGHRVTVIARPDAEVKSRAAGLDFAAIGEREYPKGSLAAASAHLGSLTALAALRFTIGMLRQSAEVSLRDTPEVIRSRRIEGLLVDQLTPAPCSVAEVLGIPFVHACNALALNLSPDSPPGVLPWNYRPGALGRLRNHLGNVLLSIASAPVTGTLNVYRRRHGLPPKRPWGRPNYLAAVAQQPGFFDFPSSYQQPRFFHTGPWHTAGAAPQVPFPWEQLDGRPLIYASLGTLQNRILDHFVTIAEAVADLDAQLVISLGSADQDPSALQARCPGRHIMVPIAPQLALLQKASLVITHAGLNTTLESLAQGLPLVAIPITNDQPGVAARIQWLGVGVTVPPSRLTTETLRSALRTVLSDPGYRTRSRECQRRMAAIDGPRLAADITLAALESRAPIYQWPP